MSESRKEIIKVPFGKYKDKNLGTFGSMATLSFHETKNIISGEGGALLINDDHLIERAEIIWEKVKRLLSEQGIKHE